MDDNPSPSLAEIAIPPEHAGREAMTVEVIMGTTPTDVLVDTGSFSAFVSADAFSNLKPEDIVATRATRGSYPSTKSGPRSRFAPTSARQANGGGTPRTLSATQQTGGSACSTTNISSGAHTRRGSGGR